jgi:hypothetical protein
MTTGSDVTFHNVPFRLCMINKIVIVLLLGIVTWPFLPTACAQASGITLEAKLTAHVGDYDLGKCTFVEALIRVSNSFEIPMGIEWVDSGAGRAEYQFSWKDATVREVIESIASTLPGYQVNVSNGVVHVFASGLIPTEQDFINIRIGSFSAHQEFFELAIFKLHDLLAPPRGNRQISIAGPGDSKVNLELNNATVEEIFDALALGSNRKIWVVGFEEDSSLTTLPPKGMRRTTSLWTDNRVPDDTQPCWDFFRWGDPMPPRRTK